MKMNQNEDDPKDEDDPQKWRGHQNVRWTKPSNWWWTSKKDVIEYKCEDDPKKKVEHNYEDNFKNDDEA